MRFVDTNVLLYAISNEPGEAAKSQIANSILDDRHLTLSTQVLQEFYVQATRPNRTDALSHEQASGLVVSFCRFDVQPVTTEIVLSAMTARHRHQISYWDAAIIEAARTSGCETVLSEDLNNGQNFGGVKVENPFR